MLKKNYLTVLVSLLLLLSFSGLSQAGAPLESKLPIRTIIIDGNPSDWDGVPTFMTDPQGDSNCGVGTDIKAIYFAKDNNYLYWRMDTWSGSYSTDGGPQIAMLDDNDPVGGCPFGGVLANFDQMDGGFSVFDGYPVCEWDNYVYGPDYGRIDQIAEGKIPLNLFADLQNFSWIGGDYGGCDEIGRPLFSYFDMNHSIYQDGRDVYRISFNVNDAEGITFDEYIIDELELIYDPLNNPVSYPTENVRFDSGPEYRGTYNSGTGEFSYNLRQVIEHLGPVGEELSNGVYRLTAKVDLPLGIPYIERQLAIEFSLEAYDIPIVSSSSFQVSCDDSGNFIWEWDAPEGFNDWTHARALINVFNQENYLGQIYGRGLPTDLGRLFVPADIIQAVESWGGDRYELEANIRTNNDGRERTYSNKMVLTSLCAGCADVEEKVAFPRGGDIWIMNPDGTNEVNLTNSPQNEDLPSFSPDGSKIAYINYDTKQLCIMNNDGTDQTPIYDSPYAIIHTMPTWSPGGKQIAFSQGPYNHYDIWVINSDGTDPHQVTTDGSQNQSPSWSPDGSKIAFTRHLPAGYHWGARIFTMNPDGSGQQQHTYGFSDQADWSPDSTKIAYHNSRSYDIYIMDRNGDNKTQITSGSIIDYGPAWSPDGTQLMFQRWDGAGNLWIVNVDDLTKFQITTSGNFQGQFDWSRICVSNQPPVANAGIYDSQSAEENCEAQVNLDGTGSSDPDEDPLTYSWAWWIDGAAYSASGPTPTITLPLGTHTITLTVDDGQVTDTDSVVIIVEDITPPAIQMDVPTTIIPPDAPISFEATVSDNCEATLEITDYDCFKFTKKGKRIDKTESCVVNVNGDTITILDTGGVGDHITWTVTATDGSDNTTTTTFEVEVVNPGKKKGKK
ncbi:PKD domain-containing protein [Thermodesulfobacteriota bacterium]